MRKKISAVLITSAFCISMLVMSVSAATTNPTVTPTYANGVINVSVSNASAYKTVTITVTNKADSTNTVTDTENVASDGTAALSPAWNGAISGATYSISLNSKSTADGTFTVYNASDFVATTVAASSTPASSTPASSTPASSAKSSTPASSAKSSTSTAAKSKTSNPKTGDNGIMSGIVAIIGIGAAVSVVALRNRKKSVKSN